MSNFSFNANGAAHLWVYLLCHVSFGAISFAHVLVWHSHCIKGSAVVEDNHKATWSQRVVRPVWATVLCRIGLAPRLFVTMLSYLSSLPSFLSISTMKKNMPILWRHVKEAGGRRRSWNEESPDFYWSPDLMTKTNSRSYIHKIKWLKCESIIKISPATLLLTGWTKGNISPPLIRYPSYVSVPLRKTWAERQEMQNNLKPPDNWWVLWCVILTYLGLIPNTFYTTTLHTVT